MKVFAWTQKGFRKKENEDRVLIKDIILTDGYIECELDSGIVAIADGVGGNKAGALASDFVVQHLLKTPQINYEVFTSINNELISFSKSDENMFNMATTLSGISFESGNRGLFHIGNTRISISQGDYLKQITEDHTLVNALIKVGKLSYNDSSAFIRCNEITACFGGGNNELFTKFEFQQDSKALKNVKKILITSDGIHDYLSIDELEKYIQTREFCKQTFDEIGSCATAKGSFDDRSIMLILTNEGWKK